ncbi:alpha/beta hydrolase [Nocardia suismassiliense]|uniref:alpha/beta hydrolase n=1 Tax=Nocardia suismassiliense TaxID=2077092 RepID=UPI000D1DE28F|nr:alpha/beta hydrolase [Nocardia suismassiliense]
MESLELRFYSDGAQLDGRLYLPQGHTGQGGLPLVIACSGFLGLYRIHPERFARYLTTRGFACYGFDYRGHGESGGTRNRVLLEELVRDIRCAVTASSASWHVNRDNVFLLGWAMGAGLVLDAVRELPGVKGIICVNGLYDGLDFHTSHRGQQGLHNFRQWINNERLRRARSGQAEMVAPFEIYPLDEQTQEYVTESLEGIPGYDTSVTSFEFAESLIRWSVMPIVASATLPLFIAHGTSNGLHPKEQAEAVVAAYGGPTTTYWMPNAGHTEWMQDHDPQFQRLCAAIFDWLSSQVAP